jgi:hypothetical protein
VAFKPPGFIIKQPEIPMIRGIMSTVGVAAVVLTASTAFAADLGGNCCADLEERVAELEATVAKKGTRKVSLTVYGWVNKTMFHFDDGVQTNNYLGIDNTNSATRFGFRGDAAINSEWKAGYSILLDVFTGATSARVTQASEDGGNVSGTTSTFDDHLVRMRDANVFLESSRIGRFTLGRLTLTGAQGTIDLGGIGNVASASYSLLGGRLNFRNAGGTLSAFSIASQSDALADFNARVDGLRWDSPTWHGFVIGASIGEAREVDRTGGATLGHAYAVNLRYAGEFNGVRVASAIGYEVSRNEEALGAAGISKDSVNFGTSTSLLHTATGLFAQGHYLTMERGNAGAATSDKAKNWLVQAGLQRNFFGIGATALYAEVGRVKDGNAAFDQLTAGGPVSDFRVWGLGVTQNIDAAAMQLYAGYRNYALDHVAAGVTTSFKDIGVLAVGARINF